jgi:hypothetical protein
MTAGIRNITGAIASYHFFSHNSGNNVIAVVEYTAGFYQVLGFGTLTKFGSYTGGQYFFGSTYGVSTTAFGSGNAIPGCGFFDGTTGQPTSYINATVDSEAGWKWSVSTTLNAPSSVRKVIGNEVRFVTSLLIQPNTLNNLTVFSPVVASCYRDTNNNSTTSFKSALGEVPKVFFCTIQTFIPGQQITRGSTNYRVFPFYKQDVTTSSPSVGGAGHSGFLGFAVEE